MSSAALPRPVRSFLAVIAIASLSLGLTACGSSGGGSSSGSNAGSIVAKDFSLSDLTVAPGAKIALHNEGSATHTATADDGSFDLGPTSGGQTSSAGTAPTKPGSYPFHCNIHSSMTATLTVKG